MLFSSFSFNLKNQLMGARIRFVALALAVLMMASYCLAAKVIKVDMLKRENTAVNGGRRLLDDDNKAKSGYANESSVSNHHYIPRNDFNNYPGGNEDRSG
ncbi:hypothetical protein CXB51_009001 [Gossypium anomalum]|uniref:Uncharacterized protein n=1 Tax=Gossypium anomalum TaxID=47600 RepID=A0A8J6D9N0_9ROSI|nr:hypothetical protein CXB51_009001 [Gossypium anomalum]